MEVNIIASVKRRDNKNRVLRNGESQRPDGRYCFKYVDVDGKTRFVYSWKLTDTDRIPQGKRDCISLRQQEKEIQKRIDLQISNDIGNQKLFDAFELFVKSKINIKDSTREAYNSILNILRNDPFCQLPICKITTDRAKDWVRELNQTGKGFSRITTIKCLMSSMFRGYIESDKLVKNPFMFDLSSVIKKDIEVREALTEQEQTEFFEFLQNSKYQKYFYQYKFLILTGLRAGELCGLTVNDIDFDNKTISINHQLSYIKSKRVITDLKTKKSERLLPITPDIEECLRNIIANRDSHNDYTLDGYKDFLFCTCHGTPTEDRSWNRRLTNIVAAYNKTHKIKLRNFTPHVLRHTFCSNQIRKGVPVKIVQYLMGHTNADVTMNVYSHIVYDDVKKAILGE